MAYENCINLGSDEEEDGHLVQIMTTSDSGSNIESGLNINSTEQVEGGHVFGGLKTRRCGIEVGIPKKKTHFGAEEVRKVTKENFVFDAVKEILASMMRLCAALTTNFSGGDSDLHAELDRTKAGIAKLEEDTNGMLEEVKQLILQAMNGLWLSCTGSFCSWN